MMEVESKLADGVIGVRRPHSNLMTYYALESFLLGPFFPFWLIPRYFRFRTLRYAFDEEGVSMRWGVLFHRQVALTYGRIQDIHLKSNFVERRLGLARVKVQTAAGSATAEMSIDGLQEYAEVRDYLYSRMRGARRLDGAARSDAGSGGGSDLVSVLQDVVAELRGLRQDLAAIADEEDE